MSAVLHLTRGTDREQVTAEAAMRFDAESFLRRLDTDDIGNVVCDIHDTLRAAIVTQDEALVGRVLLAAINAYAVNVACGLNEMARRCEPEDEARGVMRQGVVGVLA